MKSTRFILILGLVMLSVSAFAQPDDDTEEDRMKRHLERMTETLDLTEEQQADIKLIVENSHKGIREVLETEKERKETLKEKVDSIRSEEQQEIKKLLTTDQLEKYNAMLERKNKRRDRSGHRRGHGKHLDEHE